MNTNLLAALALVALPATALAGDKFEFRAAAGARVLKTATGRARCASTTWARASATCRSCRTVAAAETN